MRNDRLKIRQHQLKNLIIHSDIKQYHLAKKMGVSEKTIGRWVNGNVASMSLENAEKLSEVLNCHLDTFIDFKNQSSNDSIYEQLFNDDLLNVLSPLGKWETLITLLENLPQEHISNVHKGKLFNWLSIGYWRTQKYNLGLSYASKAKNIGKKSNDPIIYYQACINIGTIQGLQGKTQESLETFLKCYDNIDAISSNHLRAILLNNLSMTYFDLEKYDLALDYQEETIYLFKTMKKTYNLAIAYIVKGFCLIELGHFDQGQAALLVALNYSKESQYVNGQVEIPLYMTYGSIKNQQSIKKNKFIHQVKLFSRLDHKDPYCYYLITFVFKYLEDEANYNIWKSYGLNALSNNLHLFNKIKDL